MDVNCGMAEGVHGCMHEERAGSKNSIRYFLYDSWRLVGLRGRLSVWLKVNIRARCERNTGLCTYESIDRDELLQPPHAREFLEKDT